MKLNYGVFGDVMSFDATFRTDRYDLVFVPFTGIDNHHHNVTFGAALLALETAKSYKWLLETFLTSHGIAPKVVVTDQDPAMKISIREVFPDTRHRLCMWHIMIKVADKNAGGAGSGSLAAGSPGAVSKRTNVAVYKNAGGAGSCSLAADSTVGGSSRAVGAGSKRSTSAGSKNTGGAGSCSLAADSAVGGSSRAVGAGSKRSIGAGSKRSIGAGSKNL
ncbi:hypothetical protein L1987_30629 [Smallanthus sonchifolius]|uniref:Uncharacterized protein n=1 Tax=Smallanthus sonchifolius TaxID=185202 RepID=A0ACB9I4V4_9ASTR|nr:hypothetical protein L1987_30629 [Smallanthus sonchifolius]